MIRTSKTRPGSSTKRWRRHVAFAAPAAFVLAGAAGVAAAGGGAAPTSNIVDPGDPATAPTGPAEADGGRIPVADDDGNVAGFIDAEAYESPEGLPPADLGSGDREVFATEVEDASGRLVGYYVQLLGFVDLATARDGAAIEALFTEHEAMQDRPLPSAYREWLEAGEIGPSED